ncbi:hypothetical protein ASG25_16305 [Rhizobium sp. Leaf384]|uniref:hypothetical protein n=1 Tax=unclassified Rhizobium TaxID=2613769 RepID=UPI000715E270|nr:MULTISPECIES: hypothetical protein [unclassified Rhizobium]KQS76960.1 hypothetical protein ASG25_16305 [Rhizobium sp. Leaf384]KQS78231.1 hypothetical protein ASG58_07520 [Rhizobium sp. Leaf383]
MFGKSLFQSVLERLDAENPPDALATPRHAGISGIPAGLAFDTEPTTAGDAVRQAYADMVEVQHPAPMPSPQPQIQKSKSPPPQPRQRPAYLDRLSPADVAEDLDISSVDTLATLAEKRRAFATRNHPDRHAPEDLQAATTRMTIANMLVDEAMRRTKRGRPMGTPARRPR